jgi:hypothetical protein
MAGVADIAAAAGIGAVTMIAAKQPTRTGVRIFLMNVPHHELTFLLLRYLPSLHRGMPAANVPATMPPKPPTGVPSEHDDEGEHYPVCVHGVTWSGSHELNPQLKVSGGVCQKADNINEDRCEAFAHPGAKFRWRAKCQLEVEKRCHEEGHVNRSAGTC